MEQVQNVNGDVVKSYEPSEYKSLMTKEEANTLKELMEAVVTEGTASSLGTENYSAGGKTGSAEYYGSDGSIQTHSWFVGFCRSPEKPYAFVVVAENSGSGLGVASGVAARVLRAADAV